MSKKTEVATQQTAIPEKLKPSGTDWGPFLKFKIETTDKDNKLIVGTSDGSLPSKENATKFREILKKTTGTENPDYGMGILRQVAYGMCEDSEADRLNHAARLLPAMKPQDETESLLMGQFIALQDAGLGCLHLANIQEGFYHRERYLLLASKALNTANQTMQTLMKYRSRGQQTVQVVHLHNQNGQAIVAQNLSPPATT